MMDADEIARLRELAENGHYYLGKHVLSLLDALEQAQKERDAAMKMLRERPTAPHPVDAMNRLTDSLRADAEAECATAIVQRDQAHKDAKDARALAFEECAQVADGLNADKCASGLYEHGYWDACNEVAAALRDRIEAMLEQKL